MVNSNQDSVSIRLQFQFDNFRNSKLIESKFLKSKQIEQFILQKFHRKGIFREYSKSRIR